MKALIYNPASDQFSAAEMPQPAPGPYDVLVRVHACGLNPVDAKIHQWHGMVPGMNAHWVAGLDVSGEIAALGSAVTGWNVGDRVLYHGDMFRPHGGFAEFAIHDARTLLTHPDMPPQLAAATPCAGWSAWRALVDKLHVQGAASIFIAGGAGGVGSFAIQIARHFGVRQIITTASRTNHDYVRSLGATDAIDYHTEDVVKAVMALSGGQGVQVALDAVGDDNDIVAASVLGFEGQMVELVRVVRPDAYPDAFMKGLSFHQLSLGSGHRYGQRSRDALVEAGRQVSALLVSGEIKLPKLALVSLEEVGDVLKKMRAKHTVGKVVMASTAI